MKQKLLIAAAATALMAAPSFASAQNSDSGWYLKGAGGYGIGTDIDITGDINGDIEAEGDAAWNAGVGYEFGDGWRVEVDGTSMWNDYGAIAQGDQSFANLRTNALMLNALYDFDDFGKFAPYVGAGVGLIDADATAVAHINPICAPAGPVNNNFSCDVNSDDRALGWQLLAGLGYDITDKLTWDTNYRYLQSGDLDLEGAFINAATGTGSPIAVEFDGVGAHQLLTGFRYRFGASAPKVVKPDPLPVAPVATADFRCWDGSLVFDSGQCPIEPQPVAPQPQPTVTCWDGSLVFDAAQCPVEPTLVTCPDGSRTSDINFCATTDASTTLGDLCGEQYRQEIIYYEFDKGASAETRNTISRILDAGQFCNVENIRVVGHTDTSGAASYNLALSKRRATDALNELVRQGINRNTITAEGKGETEPFVQTGDGVKEQLNRRTEVQITLGSVGAIN